MSYCVNCGVELAAGEKSCPLCGVEAVNPLKPYDPTAERPYPSKHETVMHRAIRIVAAWVLLVLSGIPVITMLLVDLVADGRLDWSLLPVASIVLGYMVFVFPCLFKRPKVWLFMLFGTVETAVYLFVLHVLIGGNWYYLFALPVTFITGAAAIGVYLMVSAKKPSYTLKITIVLVILAVFTLLLQLLIELCFFRRIRFDWSIYTAIALSMLSIAVVIAGNLYRRNERFRKKMFF